MADDDSIPESDRVEGYPHPREATALYGQDTAERQFLDAWASGRLHHAWLLRGPRGVGKATLAYRIARALIATGGDTVPGLFGEGPAIPSNLDFPADCPVRSRILARSEPQLFVLRRQWDADKKRMQTQIAVDHVRALRHFLQMSAPDGGWRVVLVDPADEMNRSSANALLKYLEEPPAKTLFLLLSHAPAGLLPTIRSRCRTLDLGALAPDAMTGVLESTGAMITPGDAAAVAELSGGSAGDALRLLADDGLALYRRIVSVMAGAQGVDRAGMVILSENCAGRAGADRYRLVLDLTQRLIARLARTAATGALPLAAAPEEPALMKMAASHPMQAYAWAEVLTRISAKTRHAVAVNLDPAQVVIDIFLELDATLADVRKVAA